MSWVTNIILHLGLGDEDKLARVNEYFAPNQDRDGFVSLDSEKLPPKWYGGHKMLEVAISVMAANHIDRTYAVGRSK